MAIDSVAPLIIGAAMTTFGKFSDRSVRSLTTEAVAAALNDADIAPSDVDIVFFANAVGGILHAQEMIRGQSALRETGLLGTPIVNTENACASASSAFMLATMAVSSGAVDVALAVGAEKLTHPDKRRSVRAIATAVDLEEEPGERAELSRDLLGWVGETQDEDRAAQTGSGRSKFMDIYAEVALDYMRRSGATVRDLAEVAAKNHSNGALNPRAHYGSTMTAEDVMRSRPVSGPLTLLMCSPVSDGAAAVVVCSSRFASRLDDVAPIRVGASVLVSGRARLDGGPGVVPRAATLAFEQAGVGPQDIDIVELHDAAAPGELIQYEELGLCAEGDGPRLLASGDTRLGGRVPVNASGGLLARGHPIGATGCAQLVELVDQLRGRAGARQVADAQVALAENAGGHIGEDAAAAVVTILIR